MPDLIRAFALIGIALVNVEAFSSSFLTGYSSDALSGSTDRFAHFTIAALFSLKSYSLFSMMFGAGLGYQLSAGQRHQSRFAARYFRRMAGLLIIGFFHAVFLFVGDILISYALLGSLLFFFRDAKPQTLFVWGVGLIILETACILLLGFSYLQIETRPDLEAAKAFQASQAAEAAAASARDAVFRTGDFLQVALARLQILPTVLSSILFLQALSAFGFFLLGLCLYRLGWLSDPAHRFWWWARWVIMPLGLMISIFAALLYASPQPRASSGIVFGLAAIMAASAFSSAGYIGWIAKLSQNETSRIIRFIARGGSATLSAYLLQSIVMSLIFMSYGLGWFEKVSAHQAILIALVVGLFSLCAVSLWRLRFPLGPAEYLLRRWIWLGRPAASNS